MRRTLVLFVRAPVLGSGKRRLAHDIGAIAALRFERAMLALLLRRLGRDGRWRLVLAVTPDRARPRGVSDQIAPPEQPPSPCPLPPIGWRGLRRVGEAKPSPTRSWVRGTGFSSRARRRHRGTGMTAQGRGDLGARMRRAMGACPKGLVALIGADIPALKASHIAEAFQVLGTEDLVFGPAADGGFWLVGARHRPLPPRLFDDVRWSSPWALADTLAGLPPRLRVGFADSLEDVDDGEAYRRLAPRRGF